MLQSDDKKGCAKLSFTDLVLSVLPWPFHRDLPSNYCGKNPRNTIWDLVMLVLRKPTQNESHKGKNDSQEKHNNV